MAGRIELPESSWGAGKDWQVWDNDAVGELNDELVSIQKRLFAVLDELRLRDGSSRLDGVRGGRHPAADQLVREAMLASSSDWAFMITRDTAAGYAWQRARSHAERFFALADALQAGGAPGAATGLATELYRLDGPFGQLDARTC